MIYRSWVATAALAMALIGSAGSGALAAEGATTHYMPGLQAITGFALPPPHGLTFSNIAWSQDGDVDATVQGNSQYDDVTQHRVLDIMDLTYGTDGRFLRGTYSASIRGPFGPVNFVGDRVTSDGSLDPTDETSVGLGDIELIPLRLNWTRGNFHFMLSQSIIVPTGYYDVDDPASVGRGYWSFDTIGAVTYYNPRWGTELSWALGLMHNADSIDLSYHTANESHTDFEIKQRITDTFALSLNGYRLNQLKKDRGDDTVFGYSGEAFSRGIGGGFTWAPAAYGGALEITGTYMSDFEARDGRLEGDYGQLSVSWTF
jgi:hypothetical protein